MPQTVVGEDSTVWTAIICMYDGSAICSTLNCFDNSK